MATVHKLTPAEFITNRSAVLATYRHLLRATRIAFQGDTPTLLASRDFARRSFRERLDLAPGGHLAAQGVEHAQGVTKILRENVVQGKQAGEDANRYKLNIHEHTQKLDNETASLGKGTVKSFKEIKNATF